MTWQAISDRPYLLLTHLLVEFQAKRVFLCPAQGASIASTKPRSRITYLQFRRSCRRTEEEEEEEEKEDQEEEEEEEEEVMQGRSSAWS